MARVKRAPVLQYPIDSPLFLSFGSNCTVELERKLNTYGVFRAVALGLDFDVVIGFVLQIYSTDFPATGEAERPVPTCRAHQELLGQLGLFHYIEELENLQSSLLLSVPTELIRAYRAPVSEPRTKRCRSTQF